MVTRALMRALDRLPGLDPTYVILGGDDYVKYPAPWWARLTSPWEAEYIARVRSGVKGHFSYRAVAWEMKQRVEELEPELGRLMQAGGISNEIGQW